MAAVTGAGYGSPMTDDLIHIFVAMRASGDMKMSEWALHIEELRTEVATAVSVRDWGYMQMYGPDNHDFGFPAICIEAKVTADAYEGLLDSIAGNPWLSLAVEVHLMRHEVSVTVPGGVA